MDTHTISIDVIDNTIPLLNDRNIPVINQPNPCYGYSATAKEVMYLIQLSNYRVYESGTNKVINGNNYYTYFPEESGESGGGGGAEITVDELVTSTSTNPVQSKGIYEFVNNEVDPIKSDLGNFKKLLKPYDLKWTNGTCYMGSVNYDSTIITSEMFGLSKGDVIYFGENTKCRITRYNADGSYKDNTGSYVYKESYTVTSDNLLYRISLGCSNSDYSDMASWIYDENRIRFSDIYVCDDYVPLEKYKEELYTKKRIKPVWMQGSIYEGVLDESIVANISCEKFYAPVGTKIYLPPEIKSVRITFYDMDGNYIRHFGYLACNQYISNEDCYIALSLYDSDESGKMDVSKGDIVLITKDELNEHTRIELLEKKTTELETKTTELEKKTTELERIENVVIGYSGNKIELVENKIYARQLVKYSGEKWGNNAWAGGLSIYNNMALVGYNGYDKGHLAIYDIYKNKLIASGDLSNSGNNHVNNLAFDYTNIQGDLPVVYLTRAIAGNSECHVEKISISDETLTTELLQTITYSGQYIDTEHTVNWCLNRNTNEIIAIIYESSTNVNIISFDKPTLDNQTVRFTDTDIKKVVSTNDISVLQSSDINGNRLFITDGYSNGYLKVISLDDGSLINSISLNDISKYEPEGLCIYKNKVYINFHTENDIECILYECVL